MQVLSMTHALFKPFVMSIYCRLNLENADYIMWLHKTSTFKTVTTGYQCDLVTRCPALSCERRFMSGSHDKDTQTC